ncbi:hypothetical protein RB614_00910 [Phytohabitans sp. ZYX-F-186]|uniref:Uncharacterized protein n=1 Tax=Phytohabitans maris TaxID=3071409 RepID=A0ABU0Z9R8_9ACTN|nr:hypothetical protein [Phytohabitans sp. ZYX-F-186]MDQ7903080.1 hypothetical protein [Phytohabitans sp. ZYX-F-186]
MKRPTPGWHWLRWGIEGLLTVGAFWLAYVPLEGRPEQLSLALTAMAAVSYTALNFETMLQGRRQVHGLAEQIAIQRDELEHSRTALEQQAEETVKQRHLAEEAREAAHRTFLETVYTRYDASAPNVSVSIPERYLYRHLETADGKMISDEPTFIERDDLEDIRLSIIVTINFDNFGPNAVLVTNLKKTSGWFVDSSGDPLPDVWLLRPSYDSQRPNFRWRYEGTIGHLLAVMGQAPPFGVQCVFEVRDLVGNVTDTHTLDFSFTAVEKDGSRAKLPPHPAPILLKDLGLRDTGGVAKVERKYRDPMT